VVIEIEVVLVVIRGVAGVVSCCYCCYCCYSGMVFVLVCKKHLERPVLLLLCFCVVLFLVLHVCLAVFAVSLAGINFTY